MKTKNNRQDAKTMKTKIRHELTGMGGRHSAFTLIELLTVIAIIAILAAMLLPVVGIVKTKAKVTEAKLQIQDIVTAIQNYNSAYSRMPISPAVQALGTNDFTYGGTFNMPGGTYPVGNTSYPTNNSEVMAILMNITNTTVTAVNANAQKNPQQTIFLNAKMVGDTNTWPGVGPDLVYRDPWGNPYIISMDLNEDNQCLDAFYSLQTVSQQNGQTGYNGLVDSTDAGDFSYHGNVMVWSVGPDKQIDPTSNANTGANKDNIISWQ